MTDLGTQLEAIITPRFDKLNVRVAGVVAEDIRNRMLDNTLNGRSFENEEYKPTYSASYVRSNPRKGGQNKPVTLRDKDFALETAKVDEGQDGAEINFVSKGRIFKYHHLGEGRNPIRRIFPTQVGNVPAETKSIAQIETLKVLRGK
jgi:hypothetical protein